MSADVRAAHLQELGCHFFVNRHDAKESYGPFATYEQAVPIYERLAAMGVAASLSATQLLRVSIRV